MIKRLYLFLLYEIIIIAELTLIVYTVYIVFIILRILRCYVKAV